MTYTVSSGTLNSTIPYHTWPVKITGVSVGDLSGALHILQFTF